MQDNLEPQAKNLLSRFTDDFSSVDISFITDLIYPKTVTVIDNAVADSDANKRYSVEVDSFSELENMFKKLPQNCTVIIPDISGKMILESRV